MRSSAYVLIALVTLASTSGKVVADDAHLAVAANFAEPARRLAERFSLDSGHKIVISVGSTGKFYAQIKSGAPFDLFLSADVETPRRMEEERLAVAGTRFMYAVGKIVLWSPRAGVVDDKGEVLRKGAFARLAVPNPKLAPYGAAAREAMEKLGVWHSVEGKLVQGENIAQTFQFISSGNADLGFVALSQVRQDGRQITGSYWIVPSSLYSPIQQDAALLARGETNPAARRFLDYLRSPPARAIIRAYGYDLP